MYWTGDGPKEDKADSAALGFDGCINDEFIEKWFNITRYYSEKYKDMISGWFIDGCYDHIGYNEDILAEFAKNLKAGNPDAVIAFNKGWAYHNAFRKSSYAADYTAGEMYGMHYPCKNLDIDGIRWHHYLPMGHEYCAEHVVYTNTQMIEYIKTCVGNGGFLTLGNAATGDAHQMDEAQMHQLRMIREVIREGKENKDVLKKNAFDKIEAKSCVDMNLYVSSLIDVDYREDYGMWVQGTRLTQCGDSIFAENTEHVGWFKYNNVDFGDGAESFAVSISEAEGEEYRIEVRIDSPSVPSQQK